MKINFRTKFKEKITFVNKKGLKETLFKSTPDNSPEPPTFYSPQKIRNRRVIKSN